MLRIYRGASCVANLFGDHSVVCEITQIKRDKKQIYFGQKSEENKRTAITPD